MGHYYTALSNSPNFFVKCEVNGCPATYRRYHSFYKHAVRNHGQEYDDRNQTTTCPNVNGTPCQSNSRTEVTETEQDNFPSDTESSDSLLDYSANSEDEGGNNQVEVC